MLKNRKHHHLNITVPNYDEAKKWYVDMLNFEITGEFQSKTGTKALFVSNGEETYEIFEDTSLEKSVIDHIAYMSADLKADYEFFQKKGATFVTDGIQHADWIFENGVDYFFILSPTNERIEYCKAR